MRTRWLNLVVILAISIPLVWCFGASLTGDRVFAYRDAAHFYYPLEAWICESLVPRPMCRCGIAQDGNGMPVVADTTSAVFYPGKLVFALPLEFAQCYVWYIVLHVLLAAMGAYQPGSALAQSAAETECAMPRGAVALSGTSAAWPDQQQLSRPAAGLSAVAYAFGGTVLFQYCNVVFLVGAAWLPWALLATHRMLDRSQRVLGTGRGHMPGLDGTRGRSPNRPITPDCSAYSIPSSRGGPRRRALFREDVRGLLCGHGRQTVGTL